MTKFLRIVFILALCVSTVVLGAITKKTKKENTVSVQLPSEKPKIEKKDLDDFKAINDTCGHLAGDEALKAAARLFAKSVDGKRAMVARVGGDEFVILVMLPGEEEAAEFKRALQESMERYNAEHTLPYRLSTSMGCRAYIRGETLESFLARADEALYEEKRRKRAGR